MKKIYLLSEEKLESIVEERIKERDLITKESYERELLMKQANIAALQAQINPHFLYNALECIRAQAILEDSKDIADVTQALSRFFRYNISGTEDLITLKDELENVSNYILIQQYRFKGKIQKKFIYDRNDEQILDMMLPKMILQPIAENAIVHGFKDMTSNAEINISIKKNANHIIVTLSDNGKGMSIETLTKIREGLGKLAGNTINQENHNGIALKNVNRRLELFFGKDFGMNINSCMGVGTDVELFLPLKLRVED